MSALLCWFGLHRPYPGLNPAWSVIWQCTRCGELRYGGVAKGRR